MIGVIPAPKKVTVVYLGGTATGRAETQEVIEGKPLPDMVNVAKPCFEDSVRPADKWDYDTYRLSRFIVGDYEISAYVYSKLDLEQARRLLLNLLAMPIGSLVPKRNP